MGGKLERGKNDLATVRPDLAREWHPTKNGALRPEDVCARGSYHAWWQVEVERYGRRFVLEWQAVVSNRTGGAGCPYTSVPPKRILAGFNDLASTHPQLAALWHPQKNGALRPDQVFANAQRKYWWCHTMEKDGKSFLHEWQATPSSVHPGSCPVCHGSKCLPGYNDLATEASELLEEWDWERNGDQDPRRITSGSNRKVHWICRACGHRWSATVNNRTSGSGCPRCAFRYGTSFPEQALYFYLRQAFPDCVNRDMTVLDGLELDLYIPSIQTAVEYNGAWAHSFPERKKADRRKARLCREKGILLIRIRETRKRQQRVRARHLIECVERSDYGHLPWVLAAVSRELMEAGYLDRELGMDLEKDRQKIYGSYLSSIGERSLAAAAPELLEEWDWAENGKLSPQAVCAGSNVKVHWSHVAWRDGRPFVHRWIGAVSARTRQGQGCPICAGKQVLAGYNDLASTAPELLEEWDRERNGTLCPESVTRHSGKEVWWRHRVQDAEGRQWVHSWRTSPRSRSQGQGCPICAGKQILPGYNDLASTHPRLAAEWDWERNPMAPTEISYGNAGKVWWRHVVTDQQGRQWVHSWQASPNSRTNRRSGCPYCANKKTLAGYNDLATAFPQLAAKWDPVRNAPLTPRDVTPASGRRVYWTDRKGPRKICDRTKHLRQQSAEKTEREE